MIVDLKDLTSFRWGTVTSVSPLAIKLDGDSGSLAAVPDSLVDPLSLAISTRVRVELTERKVVIHGVVNGHVAAADPAGSIISWPVAAIPDGWLECNGQAVSRTTYSALFAIIGTTYGVGNGTTTFNVPKTYVDDYELGDTYRKSAAAYVLTAGMTDIPGISLTATTDGSEVRVEFDLTLQNAGSGANRTASFQLLCDGVVVNSSWTNIQIALGSGGDQKMSMVGTTYHTPAAGAHTWKVQAVGSAASAVAIFDGHIGAKQVGVAAQQRRIIKASTSTGTSQTEVDTVLGARVNALEQWSGALMPAFRVKHSTSFSGSGAQANRLMNWDTVWLNQGGYWVPGTSRFVAPVSGLYEFGIGLTQAGTAVGPEAGIYKNGVLVEWLTIAYDQYLTTYGCTQIYLLAGDYVQAYWRNNNGTTVVLDGTRSFFSGRLIS